jgi:hypothetical protein
MRILTGGRRLDFVCRNASRLAVVVTAGGIVALTALGLTALGATAAGAAGASQLDQSGEARGDDWTAPADKGLDTPVKAPAARRPSGQADDAERGRRLRLIILFGSSGRPYGFFK